MLKKKTIYSIVITTICSYGFMHTNIVTGTTNPITITNDIAIVSPPAINVEKENTASTEVPLYKLTSTKPKQPISKVIESRNVKNIDPGFGNQIVAISDVNLKKCIIQNLNQAIQEENKKLNLNQPLIPISSNPTDSEIKNIIITQKQAEKLIKLSADHKNIYDLAGLEYFRNLETINLGNNPLGSDEYNYDTFQQIVTNLEPLGQLPKLKELDLINCNIENISFLNSLSQYGTITTLSLSNNYITDLTPLSDLTSLIRLDLYYNFIDNVDPLSTLINLEFLDLGNNYNYYTTDAITNIEKLATLVNLKDLNLEQSYFLNNIEPLRNLTALERLNLNDCSIGDTIDDGSNYYPDDSMGDGIDYLPPDDSLGDGSDDFPPDYPLDGDIDYSPGNTEGTITDTPASGAEPLSGLTSLQELHIDNNYITDLVLHDLPNLKMVSAEGNPLNLLEISNADHLNYLNLDFTGIGRIKLTNVGLEVLELESELLTSIELRNLTKLRELRLIGLINLENYNFLKYLPRLEELDIWNLPIEQPILTCLSSLDSPSTLKRLKLGDNNLSDISFISNYTGLDCLTILDNPITSVEAIGTLSNLTQLYIYHSNISNITPLTKLSKLEHLSLKGNRISILPKNMSFPSLTGLNLSHNRLKDISALSSLKQLEYLELSHNQLTNIELLQSFTNLNKLNLRHNMIEDMTPITDLPLLDFKGNYTWYWIQENPFIIPPTTPNDSTTNESTTEPPVVNPPVVDPPVVNPPAVNPPVVAPPVVAPPVVAPPTESEKTENTNDKTTESENIEKNSTNATKVHTQSSLAIKNKLSAKALKTTLYLNTTQKAKTTTIKATMPKNYTVKYFNCSPKLITLNKKTGAIKAVKVGKAKIKVNFYLKKKWVKTQYISVSVKKSSKTKK